MKPTFFRNAGLVKRALCVCAVGIFLPAAAAMIYLITATNSNIEAELLRTNKLTLDKLIESIGYKISMTESIGNKIAYNTKVQDFLISEYSYGADALLYYESEIVPLIEYSYNYNDMSIHSISVFMSNKSIPHYYIYFLSDDMLSGEGGWYPEFAASKSESLWMIVPEGNRYVPELLDDRPVFSYVKKIETVTGKYCGVVVVNALKDNMLSSLDIKGDGNVSVFALDSSGEYIFAPPNGCELGRGVLQRMNELGGAEGSFTIGDDLVLYRGIGGLGLKVVYVVDMLPLKRQTAQGMITQISLIAMLFVLFMALLSYILRSVFFRFRKIVEVMDAVAGGQFDIRVPIEGKDEVAQIGDDFNRLIEKINELIRELLQKEAARRDAQIAALQYQINPHFIYNTIESLRMKLELNGCFDIADAFTDFGRMLRYALTGDSQYATLSDEVKYIQNYVNIMKIRYGDGIALKVRLPKALEGMAIIRLTLQPIVENSIKHGIRNSQSLLISVNVCQKDGDIVISVKDDGKGIEAPKLDAINHELRYNQYVPGEAGKDGEIGIFNINSRMRLCYGDDYCIRLDSAFGRYTQATIRIPVRKYGAKAGDGYGGDSHTDC